MLFNSTLFCFDLVFIRIDMLLVHSFPSILCTPGVAIVLAKQFALSATIIFLIYLYVIVLY